MSASDGRSRGVFAGCGEWPGWAEVLTYLLSGGVLGMDFVAVSWQELVPKLPLDDVTRAWAAEKHGL